MNYHTDIKYCNKGIHKKRFNSQRENTPTVVYTTGGDRALKFCKLRLYNKNSLYVQVLKRCTIKQIIPL